MTGSRRYSRRHLISHGVAFAASGLAIPWFIPSEVLGARGRTGANDRVNIGLIGCGRRGRALLAHITQDARVAAICDCYVDSMTATLKQYKASWKTYQYYEKMFEKENLDGVIVPVRPHQCVKIYIDAMTAGLDVYGEKPMALTVRAGRAVANAARKYGRIFQLGTQQRSIPINKFICEFIRDGGIGKVTEVAAANFQGPKPFPGPFPEEKTPDGMDWDRWLNQMPVCPYNSRYLGSAANRWYGWGIGGLSVFGSHGLDMIQYALGMDDAGPVEVWPMLDRFKGYKESRIRECPVAMRFADGTTLRLELPSGTGSGWWTGGMFSGEDCKVEIKRNRFSTEPADFVKGAPRRSSKSGPGLAAYHIQNWVDCIKSRQRANSHEELSQRSNTLTQLPHIARVLGRNLRWDSEKEVFPGDDEANAMLERPRREGYELPADLLRAVVSART